MSLTAEKPSDQAIRKVIRILDYDGILSVRDVRLCANAHMHTIITFANYLEDQGLVPADAPPLAN